MFCPSCGTQRSTDARACGHCGAMFQRRRWPLFLVVAVLVVVLGVAGFFVGSHHLAVARLNERLEEAVGRDSGYTETILKIEAESGSMTFAELFALCDKSVSDRTNLIVELRGLYPSIDSEVKAELIDHLTAENELIRQKAAFYRKQMALNSALESYLDEMADTPSSYYGWDYHRARVAKLKAEATKAVAALVTDGTQFVETYQKLVSREQRLGSRWSGQGSAS